MPETEAPDLTNENGYGFTISKTCFEAYLSYANGFAASEYERAERNAGGTHENMYSYFSICGMDRETGEPFLLLSSTDNNDRCGDEVYFCRYNGVDYSGAGNDEISCLGNFGIMNEDLLSMNQVDEINTIYVYTIERGNVDSIYSTHPFLHREDLYYPSSGSYDYTFEIVSPKGSKREWSYSVEMVEEMLANGELARIQWFHMEDVDLARVYYEEYVHDDVYEGAVENANRDDYYNDSTPLKYIPYIDSGVFTLEEENGNPLYVFNNLENEVLYTLMYDGDYEYMGSDIQFWEGADTSETKVDIYDLGNGNWKAIKRSYLLTQYGYRFAVREVTSEREVLSRYSGGYMMYPQVERQEVSSVAELLQVYSTN